MPTDDDKDIRAMLDKLRKELGVDAIHNEADIQPSAPRNSGRYPWGKDESQQLEDQNDISLLNQKVDLIQKELCILNDTLRLMRIQNDLLNAKMGLLNNQNDLMIKTLEAINENLYMIDERMAIIFEEEEPHEGD